MIEPSKVTPFNHIWNYEFSCRCGHAIGLRFSVPRSDFSWMRMDVVHDGEARSYEATEVGINLSDVLGAIGRVLLDRACGFPWGIDTHTWLMESVV